MTDSTKTCQQCAHWDRDGSGNRLRKCLADPAKDYETCWSSSGFSCDMWSAMTDPTKTCQHCAHWGPVHAQDDSSDFVDKNTRRCTRIPMLWDATDWDESDGLARVLKPEFADVKAFACDGSQYYAVLRTLPDFGCVMWVSNT